MQNTKRNYIVSIILNLIIVLLELIGLVYCSLNQGLSMFTFYTVDSNYFLLVTSTLLLIYLVMNHIKDKRIPKLVIFLKYTSTINVILTFIVVIFVLIPMGGVASIKMMLLDGVMSIHHVICPLLATISFIFFDPKEKINNKDLFLSLVPTIVYATIIIILNITKVITGPYPFLHVYEQPIYMSILWVFIILGATLLISFLLKVINNHKLNNI